MTLALPEDWTFELNAALRGPRSTYGTGRTRIQTGLRPGIRLQVRGRQRPRGLHRWAEGIRLCMDSGERVETAQGSELSTSLAAHRDAGESASSVPAAGHGGESDSVRSLTITRVAVNRQRDLLVLILRDLNGCVATVRTRFV